MVQTLKIEEVSLEFNLLQFYHFILRQAHLDPSNIFADPKNLCKIDM